MRCSVLQCVAVCCSVLQCVAVCCSVIVRVAVCCSFSGIATMPCLYVTPVAGLFIEAGKTKEISKRRNFHKSQVQFTSELLVPVEITPDELPIFFPGDPNILRFIFSVSGELQCATEVGSCSGIAKLSCLWLMSCSLLQCIVVCCSAVRCVAVCCGFVGIAKMSCLWVMSCRVLQSVAECCSVLQSVAECCRVLQSVAECSFSRTCTHLWILFVEKDPDYNRRVS